MSRGRPEVLFPLFGALKGLNGVGPKTTEALAQLHIEVPRDLLYTLPHSVVDRRLRETVQGADLPATLTVEVEIGQHRPARNKGGPYRVFVEDAQTSFQIVFFHARGDYVARLLPFGQRRIVSGKVEFFDGMAQMVHPDHVLAVDEADSLPGFEPVYPLTAGVTQKTMSKAATDVVSRAPDLPEWADPALIDREKWTTWHQAITSAHQPQGTDALSLDSITRRRLAYDELLAHQLTLALARAQKRAKPGVATVGNGALRRKVLAALPYRPTNAQMRSIEEITDDMASPRRMNRLLQGDVGSGKTLVAFMALLAAVEAGGQGVMMAPTEILARQHLEGLQPLAEDAGVVLELLTGRDKGKERQAKLAALEQGKIQILVGTHAVFQKDVDFADLRLAIIDEQHRFGVRQRLELGRKGAAVDVLVMTATPIPRSLALAQYGDMDVSVLDEKPPGRTPVKTALLSNEQMANYCR